MLSLSDLMYLRVQSEIWMLFMENVHPCVCGRVYAALLVRVDVVVG
jgi:hypothetical protein